MITTCNKQLQTFPCILVNTAERTGSGLKQSLMMNLFGTKDMAMFPANLRTHLNTLEMCGAQCVKKNGLAHKSDWRGNWAPEVARNLILRYSNEGDILLDPMIGGTTAIEAKVLNRNIICSDVNDVAIERTKESLKFQVDNKSWQKIVKRDARDLGKAANESIDFIFTHPPYADIIKYSEGEIDEDLSNIHAINEFADEMEKVASELYRVLKPNKFCAILIGDTRRKRMYQPLAYRVMDRFLNVGFNLKEDIIKRQYNCKATGFWVNKSKESNFLLIMHEHLFVFQK